MRKQDQLTQQDESATEASTIPETKPPTMCKVECESSRCNCKKKPSSGQDCLTSAIEAQNAQINAAETLKVARQELEALVGKTKSASQEYNQRKYDALVKVWKEQDLQIGSLITKLKCSVPNWQCVIECHVCPLLNDLAQAEQELYGNACCQKYANLDCKEVEEDEKDKWQACQDYLASVAASKYVWNHYELRHWLDRDYDEKVRRTARYKAVLSAWEKPAQTIEKALADNATLIKDSLAALGTDGPRVVYDVFVKLLPRHIAIGPVLFDNAGNALDADKKPVTKGKRPVKETKIDLETLNLLDEFCPCDKGEPIYCCEYVNIGKLSFRERLVEPLPYLVSPDNYYSIICCVAGDFFIPAKQAEAQAKAALDGEDLKIKALKSSIETGLKNLDKDARAAIPNVIEPCDCGENAAASKDAK